MSKIVIASDFHIKYSGSEADKVQYDTVCTFIKSLLGNCDVLILNGDIFDLWIEWQTVIIKDFFNFLKIISELIDNGVRVIYVSGNHDFWFGNFLSDTLGVELYQDYFSGTIDNKRLYITHGDLHTVNDTRYHIYRKIVRSYIVKLIVKTFHPTISLWFGKKLSRTSRKRPNTSKLKQRQEQGMIDFAEKLLDDYDIIAMGHTHQPKLIPLKKGYYINSGDWINHFSYVSIEGDKVELLYFNKDN